MDTELSMYEQIMNLPIFKGTSHDQISQFLETTPIDIVNYRTDTIIAEPFDECEDIYFILRGKFCLDYFVGASDRVPLIKELLGPGSAIGLDLLYGMHHNFGCTITAVEDSTLLRVSKKQMQLLILSTPLYFVNVMNAISHTVQRCKRISYSLHPESLMKMMAYYVGTLTEWNSEVYLSGDATIWAHLMGANEDDAFARQYFNMEVEKIMETGMIETSHNGYFKVISRASLLDTAFP